MRSKLFQKSAMLSRCQRGRTSKSNNRVDFMKYVSYNVSLLLARIFLHFFALDSIFIDRKDYEITMPRENGQCFSSVRNGLNLTKDCKKYFRNKAFLWKLSKIRTVFQISTLRCPDKG